MKGEFNMGYTHTFRFTKVQEDINVFCLMDIEEIFDRHKDIVEVIQIDYSTIHFNGKGNYGYEDFYITSDMTEVNFCKTNGKEYDIVVCEVLLALKAYYYEEFEFSSDGFYISKQEYQEEIFDNETWNKAFEIVNKEHNFRFTLIPREKDGCYCFEVKNNINQTLGRIQKDINSSVDIYNLELKVVDLYGNKENKVFSYKIKNNELLLFV